MVALAAWLVARLRRYEVRRDSDPSASRVRVMSGRQESRPVSERRSAGPNPPEGLPDGLRDLLRPDRVDEADRYARLVPPLRSGEGSLRPRRLAERDETLLRLVQVVDAGESRGGSDVRGVGGKPDFSCGDRGRLPVNFTRFLCPAEPLAVTGLGARAAFTRSGRDRDDPAHVHGAIAHPLRAERPVRPGAIPS